jgi:hypothetical protein
MLRSESSKLSTIDVRSLVLLRILFIKNFCAGGVAQRGRVPALQAQSPEFKSQSHQKKKKSENPGMCFMDANNQSWLLLTVIARKL